LGSPNSYRFEERSFFGKIECKPSKRISGQVFIAVVKGFDPAIGNGNHMGITGNVFEHVIRSFNRLPHADNPLVGVEFIFKRFVSVAKAEFVAFHCTCQMVNELATEDE